MKKEGVVFAPSFSIVNIENKKERAVAKWMHMQGKWNFIQ